MVSNRYNLSTYSPFDAMWLDHQQLCHTVITHSVMCHNKRCASIEGVPLSFFILESKSVACTFSNETVSFFYISWYWESQGLVSCMEAISGEEPPPSRDTPLFHPGEVCQGPTGCYLVCLENLYLSRHRRGVKGCYSALGRVSCVEAITDGPSPPCYSSFNIWESTYIHLSLYYIQAFNHYGAILWICN